MPEPKSEVLPITPWGNNADLIVPQGGAWVRIDSRQSVSLPLDQVDAREGNGAAEGSSQSLGPPAT